MIKELDDLKDLMNGLRKPVTEIEIIFMTGYNHALRNLDFLDKYIELTGQLDYYEDMQQWHALCLGFGLGQKKLNEEIAEFESEDDHDKH